MRTPDLISVHPDAAKNFDEKGEALLHFVSPVPKEGQVGGGFEPQVRPRAHLTEKDITGEVRVSLVDFRGLEAGKLFSHEGKSIGLVDQGFKDLQTLASRIHEMSAVRPYVSAQCIVEHGFEWLRRRHIGKACEAFTTFVIRESSSQVEEIEVWYPLFQVYIQSDLVVGKVTFKTLTPEMFARWDHIPENVPQDQRPAIQAAVHARRSKLQGCAAATIKVKAEPIRAEELASQEAELSTACLRFFHPANFTPYMRSFCETMGRENLSRSTSLVVRNGEIQQESGSLNTRSSTAWQIPEEDIRKFRACGLDALSRLLLGENSSPFKRDLLDAVLVYSRNSLFDDPLNRLIYILSALESLLLRDKNEPIQKNLGERLAFIVGATLEEREAVRDNTSRVYGLRSEFLHHGHAAANMEGLGIFMRHVWRAFVALIADEDKFRTKQDLIEALERRKMA